MPLPEDLSTQTNDEINSLINTMITYYNTNNSSFTGTTGVSYATYIPNMLAQLQRMVGANPATTLQEMIQQDTQIDLDILEAKEDLKIAESRAVSLREMNKQSYYESWFPLNRPLRSSSNIVILALGIFFFVLSLLIILRATGILISIDATWIRRDGVVSPFLAKLRYLFPFGYGTTFIVLAAIAISVAGYLRKA